MLKEILQEELVINNVIVDNWRDVVKECGFLLVKKEKVKPEFIDSMIKVVEKFGPYMILLPEVVFFHGQPGDLVNEICLSLVVLKEPVFFTEYENQNILLSEYLIFFEVLCMLVEMRARSQITLPREITKKMGISEGDVFEVIERDGGVFLCPVVVYPKAKLERIAQIIKDHEKEPSDVFNSVEDMFNDLGIDVGDDDVPS